MEKKELVKALFFVDKRKRAHLSSRIIFYIIFLVNSSIKLVKNL